MQQLILVYFKTPAMKKLLSFPFALFVAITASFSQNTPFVLTPDLEVTDSGTITREQWRDSPAKGFRIFLPSLRKVGNPAEWICV
jgi:hypothetical protein